MSVRLVLRSVWANPGNRGRRARFLAAAVGWQLYKRLRGRPRAITLANGARFLAHADCVISSALHYSEWPEYHELQFCRRQLQPGQWLFDVGANVGHFSLLLGDRVGSGNVMAFEPTPVTYRRLVENFELNGWPTTGLRHAAVGRECGHVEMPDLAQPVTTNSPHAAAAAGRTARVELVSLDSLAGPFRTREVGVLKVDVEGFEPEVFGGAGRFLREVRPRLVMFESLGGRPEAAVEGPLREAGYILFQLDDEGRPTRDGLTGQNLFACQAERWMEVSRPAG